MYWKGREMSWNVQLLSKEPITTLFACHDYYPPMALDSQSAGKVGGCLVLKWLALLPMCFCLCPALNTAGPDRLFTPRVRKCRHFQRLFFALQILITDVGWRDINNSLQCPEVCERRHVWGAAPPPHNPHYTEVPKVSRAEPLRFFDANSKPLVWCIPVFLSSALQPRFSLQNMLQPHALFVGSQRATLPFFSRRLNMLWTLPMPSSVASSLLPCPPLLSTLLGCHLAYSSFEYQPRWYLPYKAFPEPPRPKVNALDYALRALIYDPSTLCCSRLLAYLSLPLDWGQPESTATSWCTEGIPYRLVEWRKEVSSRTCRGLACLLEQGSTQPSSVSSPPPYKFVLTYRLTDLG